ncbi:MAG: citrate (Si)-synthase, partial [Thermoguttaceae bacterium]|nr:citrate (Si)-synthase [Thermoguttaceae bacterium]
MPDKVTLCVGDKKYELPVVQGTEGELAIDITRLRDETGMVTFDPSLGNTAACKSEITFID